MNYSDEEIAIHDEIQAEDKRFEETDAFKEHEEKRNALLEKSHEAHLRRLNEAKAVRPVTTAHYNKKNFTLKEKEDSPELKEATEAANKLSLNDKLILRARLYKEELEVDEEHKMSDEDLEQLHVLLVQTAIDFIKEKKLENVWGVSFSADSLQSSAEYGEWCPETDSHIRVEGIKEEEATNIGGEKVKVPYRTIIGERW